MNYLSVVVAGSRSIDDYELVAATIKGQFNSFRDLEIVHGGAKGVDSCASRFAEEYDIKEVVVEANWDEHGKAAGPRRNSKMAEYGDVLIVVWDGESNGTRNMIRQALDRGLDVHVRQVE
jgi:predicted Rossmann fold nucleotide-binding protein DprA/Smf involved in DNA uptake